MKNTILLLFMALFLSACTAMQPAAPEVNLMGLILDEVTLSHVNMKANLRLFNPNDTTISVKSVEYELELNGVHVSTGKSLRGLSIPANEYGNLDLRLSSAYWDLFRFSAKSSRARSWISASPARCGSAVWALSAIPSTLTMRGRFPCCVARKISRRRPPIPLRLPK